jgi:putative transposase
MVLQEALQTGKPQIFNTDQGSQFTIDVFTDILKVHNIQISMDVKGRAIDNIFVERLWRSVKYEYLYLQRPESCQEQYQGLKQYFISITRKDSTSHWTIKPLKAFIIWLLNSIKN